MSKSIIEIRASEGGAESKLLVKDQFVIYAKACGLECL
jgi:protein subunit release factor A